MSIGSTETSSDDTTGAGADSTGAPLEDPYGLCYELGDGTCNDLTGQCGELCLESTESEQVCAWQCGVANPCPQPLSGTAPARCDEASHFCVLDCTQGDCPDGMECTMVTYAGSGTPLPACAWPTVNWIPPYTRCVDERYCSPGESQCGLSGFPGGCFLDDDVCADWNCSTVCTPSCAMGEACPPADGGTAPATCVDHTGDGIGDVCVLDCGAGGTCPDGMACRPWTVSEGVGQACMWAPV